ncbi:hypothetical protein V8B97DRAFT_1865810 [Scleroderma yunnanense]
MSSPHDLPRPGTQLFLPSLLAHVRSALPDLPLEPVVIQVLLLCITSGDRNLILRTREEDISLVTKLVTLALGSVFGYNVHRSKCHPDARRQTPGLFLRSLFFSPTTIPTSSDGPPHKSREGHRRTSSSRNFRGKLPVSTQSIHIEGTTSFSRSLSCPTVSQPSASTPLANSGLGDDVGGVELASPTPNLKRPSLHSFGTRTEPSIRAFVSHKRSQQAGFSSSVLPTAIVVSGLEHGSLEAQKALLRTLADRKLVLSDDWAKEPSQVPTVFDLPEDFILIYVCRLDARERPSIYQSLLDRFAMSSAVDVGHHTRLVMRQYRLPSTPSSAQPSPDNPGPAATSVSPPISPSFVRYLKNLRTNHTHIRLPLNIYLADLFTATRHFGSLDAMLLTVRARQDAEALICASRVLGVDPTGAELIKEAANNVPEAPPSEVASCSTRRSYPPCDSIASESSDALLDTVDVPEIHIPSLASTARRSFAGGFSQDDVLELDVSEADIARIFPRVISHRVRVRDSPFDEVLSSAICGTVSRPDSDGRELLWERSTVKDILVHILAEV